jgi:hypothetical protein
MACVHSGPYSALPEPATGCLEQPNREAVQSFLAPGRLTPLLGAWGRASLSDRPGARDDRPPVLLPAPRSEAGPHQPAIAAGRQAQGTASIAGTRPDHEPRFAGPGLEGLLAAPEELNVVVVSACDGKPDEGSTGNGVPCRRSVARVSRVRGRGRGRGVPSGTRVHGALPGCALQVTAMALVAEWRLRSCKTAVRCAFAVPVGNGEETKRDQCPQQEEADQRAAHRKRSSPLFRRCDAGRCLVVDLPVERGAPSRPSKRPGSYDGSPLRGRFQGRKLGDPRATLLLTVGQVLASAPAELRIDERKLGADQIQVTSSTHANTCRLCLGIHEGAPRRPQSEAYPRPGGRPARSESLVRVIGPKRRRADHPGSQCGSLPPLARPAPACLLSPGS